MTNNNQNINASNNKLEKQNNQSVKKKGDTNKSPNQTVDEFGLVKRVFKVQYETKVEMRVPYWFNERILIDLHGTDSMLEPWEDVGTAIMKSIESTADLRIDNREKLNKEKWDSVHPIEDSYEPVVYRYIDIESPVDPKDYGVTELESDDSDLPL